MRTSRSFSHFLVWIFYIKCFLNFHYICWLNVVLICTHCVPYILHDANVKRDALHLRSFTQIWFPNGILYKLKTNQCNQPPPPPSSLPSEWMHLMSVCWWSSYQDSITDPDYVAMSEFCSNCKIWTKMKRSWPMTDLIWLVIGTNYEYCFYQQCPFGL